VTRTAARAVLLRNVAAARGHWLIVRVVDPSRGGRDVPGTLVTVTAGGSKRVRIADPSFSYLCASDARAHFGLASATSFDGIEVRWPDGTSQLAPGGPGDRVVVIEKAPA
jgi:hypothetical protein